MKLPFERLREARIAAGLTLAELARMISYAESTLSRVETGASEPSARLLRAIFEALQINPKWILEPQKNPMFLGSDTPSDSLRVADLPRLWNAYRDCEKAERRFFDALSAAASTSTKQNAFPLDDCRLKRDNIPVIPDLRNLLLRLRQATASRGSQSRLAKELGVPRSRVSDWVTGRTEPGGEITLRLLAWVLAEEAKHEGSGDVDAPREPKTRHAKDREDHKEAPPAQDPGT